ncbi:MFS transporter [Amphibacillus xylanus]|uniref:Major facilitator superfamily transporter n=1 Tax=Amphibacillus xylanus (strain ATCC 51415 / DSM 6626 / JCM 7361 / LMG 17667 / NBRC 15112 / Ep01) TaxID=698758 RepID=K0J7T3_AMPXN|nr:MFS transporter [Amphibacillus xylanus]BAM47918.1 major facilitator superfamily transporter [Amphibacillus xylanus NBRC 15112]
MQHESKLWTSNFIIISLTNFLLFNAFYMLMVTLTTYTSSHFQASQSVAGLASSIFVLGAVLIRPIAGKIINQVGKKKLLVFGLVMFFGFMIFYFVVDSLVLLLILRFIHGFSFGISTTATNTIVADFVPITRRGEGLGYFATSTNLAAAIGPFFGLFISQRYNMLILFIFTLLLATISLLISFFIKMPLVELSTVKKQMKSKFQLTDYIEKTTLPIGVVVLLIGFVYSSILSFLTQYATEINLVNAASFFFIFYAICLILSRPFSGKMYDLKGENPVIYASLIIFTVGMLIFSQTNSAITLLLAGALIGIGCGTIQSSTQTIAISKAPKERIGLATSTFFVCFDFGIGVGPFLLGFILPLMGFRQLYLIMAGILILCIAIYYLVHGKSANQARNFTSEN